MIASFTISLAAAAGRTGRGVTIAVVDSGIHASHPHVGGIAGGIAFDSEGRESGDVIDRLGHGTAVAAAIREKAPEAALLAVKVFHDKLSTTGRALVQAIEWAALHDTALINLSLGTTNMDHEAALADVVTRGWDRGAVVVSAAPQDGMVWLPGALGAVVGVEVDWVRPRDTCEVVVLENGGLRLRASGFPRPIPGVAPARNFQGPSFAVANATGFIALAIQDKPVRSMGELTERLAAIRVE